MIHCAVYCTCLTISSISYFHDNISFSDAVPFSNMLIEGLEHESAEIERKFAKLAASIYKSLTTQNISKDSLVACLAGFNSLTKVYDESDTNPSIFRNEKKKFEDPSTTVATVWNVIANYFSFFDYELLEMVIDILGTENDKQNIAAYKKDFETYARQRLFILPKHTTIPSKSEYESVIVKLDSSYDGCTIRALKTLQTKLSAILGLKEGVLQLLKVTDGCIQLVFKIPDFISHIIFPLSPDQESALTELGVTRLYCGDYHFRAKV